MKVNLCNKRLRSNFSEFIVFFLGILSFAFIFIDLPSKSKLYVGVFFCVLFIVIFIIMLIQANLLQQKVLNINGIKFVVKFGDLFSEKGLKTIAFNEYFDTIVDDKIISSNSLNGKFLINFVSDIDYLNQIIEKDELCQKHIICKDNDRKRGKLIKYQLGTSFRFEDYILVAFSKFDENNCAYLSLSDYYTCLINYWKEVNHIYNERDIVLPLLGTGITRFYDSKKISNQEAMEIIIQTFRYSNLSFSTNCQITLVIPKQLESTIDLYSLGD